MKEEFVYIKEGDLFINGKGTLKSQLINYGFATVVFFCSLVYYINENLVASIEFFVIGLFVFIYAKNVDSEHIEISIRRGLFIYKSLFKSKILKFDTSKDIFLKAHFRYSFQSGGQTVFLLMSQNNLSQKIYIKNNFRFPKKYFYYNVHDVLLQFVRENSHVRFEMQNDSGIVLIKNDSHNI